MAVQASLPLGLYDPADLRCQAERDAVQSLWQATVGESQKRPLIFWRKALTSSVDNYSPLKIKSCPAIKPSWVLNV